MAVLGRTPRLRIQCRERERVFLSVQLLVSALVLSFDRIRRFTPFCDLGIGTQSWRTIMDSLVEVRFIWSVTGSSLLACSPEGRWGPKRLR